MNCLLPQSSGVLHPIAGASRAAQRGGTVVGVVVGLLAGLVLAVVVAVFVMKSPGPFVEKVKRPGEVSSEGGALPDPNKSLSKGKAEANAPETPAAPGSATGTEATTEAKGTASAPGAAAAGGATPSDAAASSSPGAAAGASSAPAPVSVATPMPPVPVLPAGAGGSAAGGSTPAGAAAGSPGPSASATPSASASESTPERSSTYLLQIAAYRSQEDAESTKGRLALVGLEAGIARAEVNGTTFWRVRVGPFRDLDETNRARTRLAENGFDSSVIRLR